MIHEQWVDTQSIPKLKEAEIHIYKINIFDLLGEFEEMDTSEFLTKLEHARLEKFRFTKDKVSFFTARYATKLLCSKYLNRDYSKINIGIQEHGKPFLPEEPKLQFNFSHSGSLVALAFGLYEPLGIDTEVYNVSIDHLELAHSVFSKKEISQLENIDDIIHGFYNCWSKKESYIKAKGKGLQIPLDEFSVKIMDQGSNNLLSVEWDSNEKDRWQIFNFDIQEKYGAACTCSNQISKVKYHDITNLIAGKLIKK